MKRLTVENIRAMLKRHPECSLIQNITLGGPGECCPMALNAYDVGVIALNGDWHTAGPPGPAPITDAADAAFAAANELYGDEYVSGFIAGLDAEVSSDCIRDRDYQEYRAGFWDGAAARLEFFTTAEDIEFDGTIGPVL